MMFATLMNKSMDMQYLYDEMYEYYTSKSNPRLKHVVLMFLSNFWGWEQQKDMERKFEATEYDPKTDMYSYVSKWFKVLRALYTLEHINPARCVIAKLPIKFQTLVVKHMRHDENITLSKLG